VIDGRREAEKIMSEIRFEGTPCLAVILVGNAPASVMYTKMKVDACKKLGITSIEHRLEETVKTQDLILLIQKLNIDPRVHGILIQMPLPKHIDKNLAIMSLAPKKDVDGFHPMNLGKLLLGVPAPVACTPLACMHLIKSTGISIKGKDAVIIGNSVIVGKPLLYFLTNEGATVTMCTTHTEDLAKHTKRADILVSATGVAGLIKKEMVKKNAVVIDVGINRDSGKLRGDVDPEVAEVTPHMTPVPGGVGPVTIAMLMRNTVQAYLMLSL